MGAIDTVDRCSIISKRRMTCESETLDVHRRGIVRRFACISRIVVLSLVLLCRSFVKPYDTSSVLDPDCLSSPRSDSYHHSVAWPSFAARVEGSIVWDSVHFVRIAQCGYEYDQSYAFLPLLPTAISLLSSTVFAPIVPFIGKRAVLGLSGYVINNIAFLFSADYFYRISSIILKDQDSALRASILFCFNPASIFYSTIYSESLYSLFYLGGLHHLLSGSNNGAMLYFSISAFARSNGILNAGYFVYQILCDVREMFILRRNLTLAMKVCITGVLRCLCVFIPFIGFQVYGYYNLCFENEVGIERPWCKATPPLLYNYIQSHYWGVGFLKYFQLQQIPNFILASPILLLSLCAIVHFFKSLPDTGIFFGKQTYLSYIRPIPTTAYSSDTIREEGEVRRRRKEVKGKGGGWANVDGIPFVIQLGVMAATAFFVMNVQVATRFLSSSPPIYWFASWVLVRFSRRRFHWGYFIWVYSFSYLLLGTLLFSNFYPFT